MKPYIYILFSLLYLSVSAQDNYTLDSLKTECYFNKFYSVDTLAMRSKVIEPLDSGGFLIGGIYAKYTDGAKALYIRKINDLGETELFKVLDSGDYEEFEFPGWMSTGRQMIKTNDGHFVIAYVYGKFEYKWGIKVLKITEEGTIIWEKYYEQIPPEENIFHSRFPYTIVQTTDGGYFIGGHQSYEGILPQYYILKLDAFGEKEWEKVFTETDNATVLSGKQTLDGGFIVSGFSTGDTTLTDTYIIKMDSLGNIEWDLYLGTENGDCGCYLEDLSSGEYLVHGCIREEDSDIWTIGYIAKLSSSGEVIWETTYQTFISMFSMQTELYQKNDGGFVGVGSYQKNGWGDNVRPLLLDFDSLANLNWMLDISPDTLQDVYTNDLEKTETGFVVAGYSFPDIQRSWVISMDSLGNTCSTVGCDSAIYQVDTVFIDTMTSLSPSIAYSIPLPQVYPNPGKGIFTFSIPLILRGKKLILYDVFGKKIWTQDTMPFQEQIIADLSHLKSGVYFYQVGERNKIGKLIIN